MTRKELIVAFGLSLCVIVVAVLIGYIAR